MRTAVYVFWALVVIGYFMLGLWAMLEKMGDKVSPKGRHEARDIFKQFVFVVVVIGICVLSDLFLVDSMIMPMMPDFVPRAFIQVILLPAVLYLGSLAIGGSKPLRVEKGKKPGQKSGARKQRKR